ncbi:MAG: HK97 family phage prohead protease, partial [Rhodococcus sp. (in: high G+C Gram-positive bacteria)]
ISGIAVPFEHRDQIGDPEYGFVELFDRRSFDKTLKERGAGKVRLLAHHDMRSNPLGRTTVLRADSAGLYMEARVSKTVAGDEFLELVRDGAMQDLSIGFRPITDTWSKDRKFVRRNEVALHEISAVNIGALAGAAITGVRTVDSRSLDTKLAMAKLDLI